MNDWYIGSSFVRTTIALAVQAGRRGDREDGVALELDQRELGLHALDDGVQERPEHGVGRRDAAAEVDAVLLLDTRHEARVARDVSQQQVALACRRIGHCD